VSTSARTDAVTPRPRRTPVPETPQAGDPRQPLLHHHVVVAAAPSVLLCSPSGDLDSAAPGDGAQGLFHADIRAVSRIRLTIGGEIPDAVLGAADGAGRARFVAFARNLGDRVADPSVRVERIREITPGRLHEEIVVSSWAGMPVRTGLRLELGTDLLDVDRVKFGALGQQSVAKEVDGALVWAHGDTRVTPRRARSCGPWNSTRGTTSPSSGTCGSTTPAPRSPDRPPLPPGRTPTFAPTTDGSTG
jgi:N-terminal domain of (some) glycogen debranching enzymes